MDLYEMFSNMPMFKNFETDEIKKFIQMKISHKRFNKGYVIIKEGDTDSTLFLIVAGSVSIAKAGQNLPLDTLTPGDVFGEMSFLTKKPRHTSAIADGDVLVLRMDDDFFQKIGLVLQNKLKDHFIELLISRLDRMNELISDSEK